VVHADGQFTSWNPSSNLQPYVMALHPHVDLGCAGKKEQSEETTASKKKNQSYRGVTWDKVKQVRTCVRPAALLLLA
jgi:hypothetical protein